MNGQIDNIKKAEYFDDRIYRIPIEKGQYKDIVSVTTVLGIEAKTFLYKYYGTLGWDQAKKRLREAGDRGSRIHYAFHIYNLGGVIIYNPFNKPNYQKEDIEALQIKYSGKIAILENQDEMLAMWKLQKFNEIVKPELVQAEHTVFSIQKEIAGTLDLAINIKAGKYEVNGSKPLVLEGGLYICDLKNGAVSDSTWSQLAPYVEAYEEMYETPVVGALILHTASQTKKGIPGFSTLLKAREELRPHYKIYQHLSAVWKARNPNISKVAFEFPTLITKEKIK